MTSSGAGIGAAGASASVKRENLKEEDGGASDNFSAMVVRQTLNNNGKAAALSSCFLRIKEEPPEVDMSIPVAITAVGVLSTAVLPVSSRMNTTTVEVTADLDQGITIKMEPRALDEEEEEEEEVDDEEEDTSIDDECAFDDDDDQDMDFEVDSSTPDSFSTSDFSKSGKSSSKLSDSISPDSVVEVVSSRVKKEGNEVEEDATKIESFDFNGLKIETVGNYSKCPKCHKNIKSTFIIRHIKLHDLPVEKFNCPEKNCNLRVNRINNLFRHLREIHRSRKPYMCRRKECMARFAKAQQLKAHNSQHRSERRKNEIPESENKIYTCEFPDCGKEYKKRHHLKEHERKHTGDMKYVCEVCGKRFYIQAHMKRHLYSHTGIKPHVCRWKCGAIFASYGGRMKHERINHYDENPLRSECSICGRPFKNQQQLVKHQMTHLNPDERKDYRCNYCHIMFDTIKLRERHEERHKDGEVFACETCQKVFKNEKNLSHHIKTHHLKKEEEPEEVPAASKEQPPPQPPPQPQQHRHHQKSKKEPPPKHHCHICGPPKLFCLTSLRRHLARIHSTNYKCPREDCGKCFKEKFQLDTHVEIHRLRECHICGKKFQRKQNADIHLLGVHNFTKEDLAKLGRWNPKKDLDKCPEYMTRKTNSSFKKFREKQRKRQRQSGGGNDEEEDDETEEEEEDSDEPRTVDFVVIDDLKQEPLDEIEIEEDDDS